MARPSSGNVEVWCWEFSDDVYRGGHTAVVIGQQIYNFGPDDSKQEILAMNRARFNQPFFGGWRGLLVARSLRDEALHCHYKWSMTRSLRFDQPFVHSFTLNADEQSALVLSELLQEYAADAPEYAFDGVGRSMNCAAVTARVLHQCGLIDPVRFEITEAELNDRAEGTLQSNPALVSKGLQLHLLSTPGRGEGYSDARTAVCGPWPHILHVRLMQQLRSGAVARYERIGLNLSGWDRGQVTVLASN